MLLKRIIPCLDVDKGRVVKGVRYVDHVDAGSLHRHADLPRAGVEVGDLLEHEVLGRTERVEADGVHGVLRRTTAGRRRP